MADTGVRAAYRFGPFHLDVRERRLSRGSDVIPLRLKVFETLRVLVENAGRLVTKQELLDTVWPETTVEENNLNHNVSVLRKALADPATGQQYIETVPRVGYRFVAPVEGPIARETAVPDAAAGFNPALVRLAVLPFANLSPDWDGCFADGLTEEMISQLGRLYRDRIGIISGSSSKLFRSAAMRAREIGEALRADYLLEGSIRRQGDRARITARLVEAASETHLWVETYESHLTDYLSMQLDVAGRIARSLALELDPDERNAQRPVSSNAAAYHAYLQGRYYWSMLADTGVDQALAYLERATELDPACALAHTALARARILQAEYYGALPRRALEGARQAAGRALELDPMLFEAHMALGEVRRLLDWDWRGAEAAYAQAIALNPSQDGPHRAYGLLLASLSKPDEAIRESERACEMDPMCAANNSSGAAWVRFLAGDYDAAIVRARRAVEVEPTYLAARRILAAAYLQSGRRSEAVAELETALTVAEDDPMVIAALAHARAVIGDGEAARDVLNKLIRLGERRHVPSYHLALALVGLGDADAAFAALERACAEGDPAITNLAVDPHLRPIRSDDRFTRLIERLGL